MPDHRAPESVMKDPVTWLYPPIEPYNTGLLQVSPVHEIYFEESGNPSGKPVMFLHGGPGGGSEPKQRRFFHPARYRIVNFDQRGCGKSTPYASLEANTTWDLVGDIEKIREHLSIERWQVFGGSWGSTLALAYSETHPNRVTELVLRGIFLLRKQEIDWFYQTDAQLLENTSWIRHIPGVIVLGRYDVVCPMESAWALHRAWPEAELIITPDSGHSAFDPPNSRALVAATDKFAR
jgi:proline iminopeptidase